MKKLFSILLLIIFSFNLGGYYLFFKIIQHTAHQRLVEQFDNNQYNEEQIVEFKIPISLPYLINDIDGFKRVDGRFEHNGEIYKLIKRKYENDTLHILSIKDNEEKKLIRKFTDYANQTHDIPTQKKSHHGLVQLSKEYHNDSSISLRDRTGKILITRIRPGTFELLSPETKVPTPPPRV